MEIKVQVGSWYVVEGSAGDTVTNPVTGKPIATVEEGKQTGFLASTPYVITSNDEVGVHKANFKSPLAKLRLLGLFGGGESFALPKGYLAAEFLEATGTQYIKAAAIFNNDTKLEMLARQTGSSSNSAFFGTEHMYTTDVASKRFSCMVSGSEGHLRFDYGSRTDFSGFYIEQGVCYKITKDAEKNYIDGVLVYSNAPAIFDGLYGVLFARGAAIAGVGANGGVKCAIYWCNIFNSGKPEHAFVPALTDNGIPCMYDKVTKTQFRNSGGGRFIVGMTCKQALKLAELPAGGGELTVSLPWEARLDYGVYDALQVAKSHGWTITVQYRDAEPDNALYNKYAECTTVAEMAAVNADYKNDLTPAGEWLYPLPKLKATDNKLFAKVRVFKSYMPSCLQAWTIFEANVIEYFECDMPAMNNTGYMFYNNQKFRYAKADLSSVGSTNYMFYLAGNLVDCYVKLSKLRDDNTLWNGCQLNKASVLYSVPTLPTWTDGGTHRFTIGIHADHEGDADIEAAIAEAEAKGWAVTVQWNGTATAQAASTFGLRRKPIYAKLGEMVLPDGTQKTILVWGHYVTNWEARGYQEFTSVEEAKEYFNVEN